MSLKRNYKFKRSYMKVLLLCSAMREGYAKYFNREEENLGGWITGIVTGLQNHKDVSLSFASFYKSNKSKIEKKEIEGVTYFCVSYKNNETLKDFFKTNSFDIYHLFGAENAFSYDVFPFLPLNKTLLYIQGIISEYVSHYKAGVNDFKQCGFLFDKYLDMNIDILKKQAKKELEIFQKCKYITGRTDWDRSFVFKINNKAKYYYLSESLRDVFYKEKKWNKNKMIPHSIFVTQASYPIKGAHTIVEIIKILKQKYPDVKCTICGVDLLNSDSLATKLNVSYASFIQKLIKEYNLEDNINFIGSKSGKEVAELSVHSNAFLLASSIENSPNSLQEAMLLGVPCVSSFVGGVGSIVTSTKQVALYAYDDPMLAAYELSKIFEDFKYAEELSTNAIARAEVLTDKNNNSKTLYEIYLDIHNNQSI